MAYEGTLWTVQASDSALLTDPVMTFSLSLMACVYSFLASIQQSLVAVICVSTCDVFCPKSVIASSSPEMLVLPLQHLIGLLYTSLVLIHFLQTFTLIFFF